MKLSYLTLHGSRAYGLNGPGSDYDYRGFFLPDEKDLLGYQPGPEQITTHPSFPESDFVAWDIRKFFRLAAAANPNVLETLFTDLNCDVVVVDVAGIAVRSISSSFLSKRVRDSFGGYAFGQLKKVTNGNWDIEGIRKDAMHLLRLVDFGKQLLETSNLTVKYSDSTRLLNIRRGLVPRAQVLEEAQRGLDEMDKLVVGSPLPDEPDHEVLQDCIGYILKTHIGA